MHLSTLSAKQNQGRSDIKLIVDGAKRKAKSAGAPVDLNHLMTAVKENPPSHTNEVLRRYLK